MSEVELRSALIKEAMDWIGTPYKSNAAVKGKRGGTDCAMLLLAVYQNVGLISKEFDPRPYPPQWHVHQNVELYLNRVISFSHEVSGPPERMPLGGDVIMFQLGRIFAHGAIVTEWPYVVHAISQDRVIHDDISKRTIGKRALWHMSKRFFSYWD